MRRQIVIAALVGAFAGTASADGIVRLIETTGDPRLDGILSNVTWNTKVLTFAFPDAPFGRQPPNVQFTPLSPGQRQIVRDTLEQIGTFASLHFLDTSGAAEALLTFAQWNLKSKLGRVDAEAKGGGDGAEYVDSRGQTWISPVDAKLIDLSPSGYARHWWMHETGHILGLEHAHNNFARTPLPASLDNISQTLMTYRLSREIVLHFPRDDVYPTTYMPLDILALQHIYGPNWRTNNGDTVYTFTPGSGDYLAGPALIKGNPAGKLFLALWDGGGSDTLDFSAYAQDGIYDMRPGQFSTPSPQQRVEFGQGEASQGSIAMALLPKGDQRALIENIIVGVGNNLITANEAVNRITLGTGANRIAFHPGSRKDMIAGFGADDVIDLSGYQVPAEMVHLAVLGEDAVITIDQWPKDEIRILNFAASPQYVLR